MNSSMYVLLILASFASILEGVNDGQCQCDASKMKSCDELRKDQEYRDFMRAFDRHYLHHANLLYGPKLSGTRPEDDQKKKKAKSSKKMRALLNALLAKIDPSLKLPEDLSGDGLFDYLLKMTSYISHMKNQVVIPTVTTASTSATGGTGPAEDSSTASTTVKGERKPMAGAPKEKCRFGFTKIGDNCYFISGKESSWNDAFALCNSRGSDLAHPESRNEQRLLQKYLKALPSRKAWSWWIGGRRRNYFYYQWVHDRSPITITSWNIGEPSSPFLHPDADCIKMSPGNGYYWMNFYCDHANNIGFICQQR